MAEENEPQPDAQEPQQPHVADAQADELQQLKDMIATHGRPFAMWAGIALIAILAVLMYKNYRKATLDRASEELWNARRIEDLESVVERYPSSPVAPIALLRAAKGYYDKERYDIATGKYTEFLTRFSRHPMVDIAEMGKIFCIEAMGQHQQVPGQIEEALRAFSSFAKQRPTHFLTPQARLGEARCLENLGKFVEAKALCEDIVVAYPGTIWASKAEDSLENINRRMTMKSVAATVPIPVPTKAAAPSVATPEAAVPTNMEIELHLPVPLDVPSSVLRR